MADPVEASDEDEAALSELDDDAEEQLMLAPLAVASSLEEMAGEGLPEVDVNSLVGEEYIPGALGASPERLKIATALEALMGDDLDADGLAADIIDAGAAFVLWGLHPSPDAVAIVPTIDDWTDSDAWLEALEEDDIDAAGDLAAVIEREAQAASELGAGESASRTAFAVRLAQMLASAGVEALAIRDGEGGYSWMVLSREDLAHEASGEPWAPVGGFDEAGATPRLIGVSLGLGGQVWLWPQVKEVGGGPALAAPPTSAAASGG